MNTDIGALQNEWNRRWPAVSGSVVIEIFGEAALQSWTGAEALIDAYLELEEKTGEAPSHKHIDEFMYLKFKEFWGEKLSAEQLYKLDRFLSRVNANGQR